MDPGRARRWGKGRRAHLLQGAGCPDEQLVGGGLPGKAWSTRAPIDERIESQPVPRGGSVAAAVAKGTAHAGVFIGGPRRPQLHGRAAHDASHTAWPTYSSEEAWTMAEQVKGEPHERVHRAVYAPRHLGACRPPHKGGSARVGQDALARRAGASPAARRRRPSHGPCSEWRGSLPAECKPVATDDRSTLGWSVAFPGPRIAALSTRAQGRAVNPP